MPEPDPINEEGKRSAGEVQTTATGVRGVVLYNFPRVKDLRGDLTVGEFESGFPFRPKRYFIISGVPAQEARGEHAHRLCHQFLTCVHGQCSAVVDDGKKRLEIVLDNPSVGIYVPPMIWGTQWKYSADAALLVFASDLYDANDYIHEYSTFLKVLGISE